MTGGKPRPNFLLAVSTVLRPLFAPQGLWEGQSGAPEGLAGLEHCQEGLSPQGKLKPLLGPEQEGILAAQVKDSELSSTKNILKHQFCARRGC